MAAKCCAGYGSNWELSRNRKFACVLLSRRKKRPLMVVILGVMALIAGGIFMSASAENRKRKKQNPVPYNATDEATHARVPGVD